MLWRGWALVNGWKASSWAPRLPRAREEVATSEEMGLFPSCHSLCSGTARGYASWATHATRVPFWLDVQYFWVYTPAFYISGSPMKGVNIYRHSWIPFTYYPGWENIYASWKVFFILKLFNLDLYLDECISLFRHMHLQSVWIHFVSSACPFTIAFPELELAHRRCSQSIGCLKVKDLS